MIFECFWCWGESFCRFVAVPYLISWEKLLRNHHFDHFSIDRKNSIDKYFYVIKIWILWRFSHCYHDSWEDMCWRAVEEISSKFSCVCVLTPSHHPPSLYIWFRASSHPLIISHEMRWETETRDEFFELFSIQFHFWSSP